MMTKRLKYEERKEWAKMLYTRQELCAVDVANTVAVQETLIHKWAKEEAWDSVKCSLLISKQTQLKRLYTALEKLTRNIEDDEKEVNPKDIDLAIKYTTAIKSLEPEVTVSLIIDIAEMFTTWLRKRDLHFARAVATHFDAFIKQRTDE